MNVPLAGDRVRGQEWECGLSVGGDTQGNTQTHTRGLLLSVGTLEQSEWSDILHQNLHTHPLHNGIILKLLYTVRGTEEEQSQI